VIRSMWFAVLSEFWRQFLYWEQSGVLTALFRSDNGLIRLGKIG
jgi:hypothetical protein